jgi:mono/diheme cytochrome c family protein
VSSASRVLATWDFKTKRRRPAYNSEQTASDYVSIDFRRDVQPILNRHCVSCHNDSGPESAGLDLRDIPTGHFTVAYESLHVLQDPQSGNHANKRFVNEREGLAIESYLIEKLVGRELDAAQELDSVGRPHPSEHGLGESELLTLIRWIDLGATFLGGHAKLDQAGPSLTSRQVTR